MTELRTFEIRDNAISFKVLAPYKNHNNRHYYERCVGSFNIKSLWIKRIMGIFWKWIGVRL